MILTLMDPGGTPRALRMCGIKKLHKIKSSRHLTLAVLHLMKNFGGPPTRLVFLGRGPKIKLLLPKYFLPRPPVSEKV